VRAIYQENSIMFKPAQCPYCQSTHVQQVRPSRDDMELMDHQSSASLYAVKHILRYAAMGGAVGRHVRFTRPLIGGALGVILGGVIGGITCGVTFHFIRESIRQQLMSPYYCRQCGEHFHRLAV
jgi:hypothetical protein